MQTAQSNTLLDDKRAREKKQSTEIKERTAAVQGVLQTLCNTDSNQSASLCDRIYRRLAGWGQVDLKTMEIHPVQGAHTAQSRVFGINRTKIVQKKGAEHKLQQAINELRMKETDLSEKASEARRRAQIQKSFGNTKAALNELARAKRLCISIGSTESARMACERQIELLENVGLHRSVASALTASSTSLKKAHKSMAGTTRKVEGELDKTDDFIADVDDFQHVLAEFGASANIGFDEDDLKEELRHLGAPEEVQHPVTEPATAEWPVAPAKLPAQAAVLLPATM